ncbi:MAG: GNAT family N-acetyltransferase [Pseudomonadota bacterium]
MYLKTNKCIIRSLRDEDAEDLAKYANNRKIWINLRDIFPHPYYIEDARKFITFASAQVSECNFAIEVDNKAVGTIGLVLGKDVERYSAEIGCWLGEDYWRRGIATVALQAVTDWAIKTYSLVRVFAVPFARNRASCRVLEKVGYKLEGRLHCSATKDGKVIDQLMYAYVVCTGNCTTKELNGKNH